MSVVWSISLYLFSIVCLFINQLSLYYCYLLFVIQYLRTSAFICLPLFSVIFYLLFTSKERPWITHKKNKPARVSPSFFLYFFFCYRYMYVWLIIFQTYLTACLFLPQSVMCLPFSTTLFACFFFCLHVCHVCAFMHTYGAYTYYILYLLFIFLGILYVYLSYLISALFMYKYINFRYLCIGLLISALTEKKLVQI